MPRPIYAVESYCRRTRRAFDTLASGLTMDSASNLAATLRAQDAANEAVVGYRIATMPLHLQVSHLAAAETMCALRDETPLRRVA